MIVKASLNARKFGAAVKEISICLLLVIVALVINGILFVKQYPKDVVVPDAAEYVQLNRDDYVLKNATIQEAKAQTEVFESSKNALEQYLTEYRYTPGTVNPFVAETGETDLPSDFVSTPSNSNKIPVNSSSDQSDVEESGDSTSVDSDNTQDNSTKTNSGDADTAVEE